ncbi:endonuclease/exonuclease/phosphatase [Cytophagales bacterium RKSG123]|nr:endonuclease/exonuclease/phosphatase [Xanthovirga aplysinae]
MINYSTAPSLEKDTFSVMTYNIGFMSGLTNNVATKFDPGLFRNNKDRAIELVKKYQPDFIGFQEIDIDSKRSAFMNQLDTLGIYGDFKQAVLGINWDKRYVPFPYWPISANYGKLLSAQAVLTKYPVTDYKRVLLEKPEANPFYYNAFYIDRLIQVLKLDINGKPLVLINVHLEAFDRETREKHAKVLLDTYKKYKNDYPVLVIGDFNSRQRMTNNQNEQEATIDLFRNEPNLTMAISDKEFNTAPEDFFTFDSGKPYEKIDYIFYTNDKIKMVKAKVLKDAGTISDHLPVLMKFVLI